jgi:hypothetical protein
MQYRLYLIGADNRIQAAESFIAGNETEAREVAAAVHGSCSTSFDSVELWQGSHLIMRQCSGAVRVTTEVQKLIDKTQESVAQLEEMMERSFTCVRASQQLMATLRTIRKG